MSILKNFPDNPLCSVHNNDLPLHVSSFRFRSWVAYFLSNLHRTAKERFHTDRYRQLTLEKTCCILLDILCSNGLACELTPLWNNRDKRILLNNIYMLYGRVMAVVDESSPGYNPYGEYFVRWSKSNRFLDQETHMAAFNDYYGVKLNEHTLARSLSDVADYNTVFSKGFLEISEFVSGLSLEIDLKIDPGSDSGILVAVTTLADIERYLNAQHELNAQIYERRASNLRKSMSLLREIFNGYAGINKALANRIRARLLKADAASRQVSDKRQKRAVFGSTFDAILSYFGSDQHPHSEVFENHLLPYLSEQHAKWKCELPASVLLEKRRLETLGQLAHWLIGIMGFMLDVKEAVCRVNGQRDARGIGHLSTAIAHLRAGIVAWNTEIDKVRMKHLAGVPSDALYSLPPPMSTDAKLFYSHEWRSTVKEVLSKLSDNVDILSRAYEAVYAAHRWKSVMYAHSRSIGDVSCDPAHDHILEKDVTTPVTTQVNKTVNVSGYAPQIALHGGQGKLPLMDMHDQSMKFSGEGQSGLLDAHTSNNKRTVECDPEIRKLLASILTGVSRDATLSLDQFEALREQYETLVAETNRKQPRQSILNEALQRLGGIASVSSQVMALAERIKQCWFAN